METESLIRKFVDEVVLPRKRPLPGLPDLYRKNPGNGEEWDDWIELGSTVTHDDFSSVEEKFNIVLPEPLKAYFEYKVIFDGDFGIYRFPDMRPNKPLDNLISEIELMNDLAFFKKNKLVPFAQDGNDGGPVCFKFNEESVEKGFPIYFTDHELLNHPDYEGELLFDSFVQFIEAIEKDMKSYG